MLHEGVAWMEFLKAELATMSDEKLMEVYRQAQIDLSIVAEREVFIEAFRLGARLVLDIVGDYRGNFYTATDE